jgi:predicted transcriptional regulator
MFTVQYGMIPYIKQITFSLEKVNVALIRDVTVASSAIVTGLNIECGWSVLFQRYKLKQIVSVSDT